MRLPMKVAAMVPSGPMAAANWWNGSGLLPVPKEPSTEINSERRLPSLRTSVSASAGRAALSSACTTRHGPFRRVTMRG